MRISARRVVVTVLITLVLLAGFVVVYIYTGSYNVAATREHTAFGRWALTTLKDRSIAAHASEVPNPPRTDSAMLADGFTHYHEMCVVCHGAPGMERGEFGKGINPTPPDLAEEATEFSARELFWITKHGIKMAGMPAFGVTHSDEEIWGIVAFLERLPQMSETEYQQWMDRYGLAASDMPGHTGHSHAPGTPPHAH